jgi:hypothetical protein
MVQKLKRPSSDAVDDGLLPNLCYRWIIRRFREVQAPGQEWPR